jgi:signal transduction histidine kinase
MNSRTLIGLALALVATTTVFHYWRQCLTRIEWRGCFVSGLATRRPTTMNSRTLIGLALALVATTTVFHYATDPHAVEFHNFYRRLYYLPIVIGAFAYGLRGGFGVAAAACAAYIPHAFFSAHRDPSPAVDKGLELVLFVVIGLLTGWLVDREREARRRLERSLAERTDLETQLIRAGRLSALGELVAGVAHEIRNPLASIKGSADAIATEISPEHRKYPMVQILGREIERLERVVSTFLDFARPAPPSRRPTDLSLVIRQAVELLESSPLADGVQIVVDAQPLNVRGDADQLVQVVLNVGLNAVRAAAEGPDGMVTLSANAREVGDTTRPCITIRDNGPGISDHHLEQIFDPFFTTRDEGTGLGLSISNRIIEAHNGFIDVESDENGSTFYIYLEDP